MLAHLADVKEVDPVKGTVFYEGRFYGPAGNWLIRVAECGAGNVQSAITAERAITDFSPEIAMFVGVAGGIKDVQLGDVVAATEVYGYERGREEAEGFRARSSVGRSGYYLVQRAAAVRQAAKWPDRIKKRRDTSPRAFVGPIAAGEKVIASDRAPITLFIRQHYSDALGVEMEGRGFLETMHMNPRVDGLVVRGISDRLGGKEETDHAGWQPIAAENAAAFAFEVLGTFPLPSANRSLADEKNARPSIDPQRSPVLDRLIDRVIPGDETTSDAAAVEFLKTADFGEGNQLFTTLLSYLNGPDDNVVWKALPLIQSSVRLAPWLIDHQELRRMGNHPDLSVRAMAALICSDLAEYAPDRVPIDLVIKLSTYKEDWYVQAPANVALKEMAAAMPSVLRIFFMRLQDDNAEERENAALMLLDVADNEPELLGQEELRAEISRLRETGDKETCTHLRKALRKVEKAPNRRRHKYGI